MISYKTSYRTQVGGVEPY